MTTPSIFLFCRAGFENEMAAEIAHKCSTIGSTGFASAKPNSGFITWTPHDPASITQLMYGLSFNKMIFARQLIWSTGICDQLPETRRDIPLLEFAEEFFNIHAKSKGFSEVFIETPDTNEAKEMQGFTRSFERHFEDALIKKGFIKDPAAKTRIHLIFDSWHRCHVGVSFRDNSSPFIMGIPRLKFPSSAPSRSTLKLDEAFQVLLNQEDRDQLLHNASRAVDLGASPGGWTWQLVKRGMLVTAIDNAKMDSALMESGLVEHLQVDGFRYVPKKPVDLMVCDMVESPSKVSKLVANWLASGQCHASIFNLKLPMKKRWQEVCLCLEIIERALQKEALSYHFRCKQLYHDRDEVTVFFRVRGQKI